MGMITLRNYFRGLRHRAGRQQAERFAKALFKTISSQKNHPKKGLYSGPENRAFRRVLIRRKLYIGNYLQIDEIFRNRYYLARGQTERIRRPGEAEFEIQSSIRI